MLSNYALNYVICEFAGNYMDFFSPRSIIPYTITHLNLWRHTSVMVSHITGNLSFVQKLSVFKIEKFRPFVKKIHYVFPF